MAFDFNRSWSLVCRTPRKKNSSVKPAASGFIVFDDSKYTVHHTPLVLRFARRSVHFRICSVTPEEKRSGSFANFQKIAHLPKLLLDSIHLLVVPGPNLASLDGLTLSHLSGPDNLVHEVAEQPHTDESQGYNQKEYGSQSRNPKEDL